MATSTISAIFAVLSLVCWLATIVVLGVVVVGRSRPSSSAGRLLGLLGDQSLWLAFVVAAVTMGGSLYYTKMVHFTSGDLCWFQRICEYPLAIVFLVAAIRRDREVWRYTIVPAVIGVGIAAYHTALQASSSKVAACQPGGKCNFNLVDNLCNYRYVWKFGFVSLPFMDLAAMAFLLVMTLLARSSASRRAVA